MGRAPDRRKKKPPTRLSTMATEGVFGEPLAAALWCRVPSDVWQKLAILADEGCFVGLGRTSDGGALTVYIKDGDDAVKVRGTAAQMSALIEPYSLLYDSGQP